MNIAERTIRRVDRFQQRHAVLAVPVAVVQKFGNDRASAFATRMAYQALFSLFPLLLLFTTILGILLGDRADLRDDIIDSALSDFPIIGSDLRTAARPLDGGGVGLVVGVLGTLYGALGFGHAAEAAMNTIWNIPRAEWPNFLHRRIRSIAMAGAIGVGTVASALASAWVGGTVGGGLLAFAASLLIDGAVFLGAFMVLTAAPLGWRDVRLGAIAAAVLWGLLKLVGTWYVSRVLRGADEVYGFFATVIALLTWVYAAAQLVLLAAELNVVWRDHLWPRSLTQPPLTAADREVYRRLAYTSIRRPEYDLELRFSTDADIDPLDDDRGATAPEGPPRASPDGAGDQPT